MSSSAALLGAANIAIEALFDPTFLKDWIIREAPTEHPGFVQSLAFLDANLLTSANEPPPPPEI